MRWWLLLVGVAIATAASDVEHILKVLNSWNPDKPENVFEHPVIESKKDRPARADTSYFLPSTSSCQIPGYTGEHCTAPVCEITNYNVKQPDTVHGTPAVIDVARLLNCTKPYALYVDETMFYVNIQVQSSIPTNPTFNLISPVGNLVSPNKITLQTSRAYEAFYPELSAGIYVVIPSADVTDAACNMVAQANTDISVVAGFTPSDHGEHEDFPTSVGYIGSYSTVVAHMFGREGSAKLMSVNFFGENNVVYKPKILNDRFKCIYEFYTVTDICVGGVGSYYMQFEGITFAGNTFRRIVPYTCNNPLPTTSAPTTTLAPPTQCKNRGVLIQNIGQPPYCFCEGMWTGRDCSQIICMNGGSVNSLNACDCPNSFEGQFCENVVCTDDADFGFEGDHPTLTFVIRARQQVNQAVLKLANATERLINTIEDTEPGYLRSYVLVVFSNDVIIHSERYRNSSQLLVDMRQAGQSLDPFGACQDGVLNGISAALSMNLENNSPVYVLTDGGPDDLQLREQVIGQLSIWRVPLTVFFVEPAAGNCGFSVEDPGYRALDTIAKKSGGMIFLVNPTTQLDDLAYLHMDKTVYRTQMVLSNDLDVCDQQNSYQVVAVDLDVDELVIVATGHSLYLNVTSPDQLIATYVAIYTDSNNLIWSLPTPQVGNYFFSLSSIHPTNYCNFKIFQRTLQGNTGADSPNRDLYWAFTPLLESDGYFFQPIYGLSLSMVAHLTNFRYSRSQEHIKAAVTMYTQRNGRQTEVFASNGLWRDGCSYNFYFPPFSCQTPDETIYFNFYARDVYGLAIQRAGVISCLTFNPTPHPPTDCMNGGVMAPDNSTCYCPATYTGAHCEKINCFNGGTPMGEFCNCPLGWGDIYCTLPVCLNKGPNPDNIRNHVDMVFAIELTVQGFPQIVHLNQYFPELLKDIQSQDQNWIGNYVLVGFNSTWGGIIHESPSWNPTGIIHALNTLAQTIPTDSACTVQLYRALDNAVRRRAAPPGSYIEIFLTSPPDNSERGGWSEAYEFSRQLYLTINGFLSYTPRTPTGFFCNATNDQFQLLYDLTGGSTGVTYGVQAASIPDVVRVIPLQYSSGIVFSQWNQDCTVPLRMYFPVDSYVQTIQLNVFGVDNEIKVSDFNGNAYETYSILRDNSSGWSVYEIRKPCDEGWQESGQYCIRFEYIKPKSFADAQAYCASFGAYMVDDLNAPQHAFLREHAKNFVFWLGLRNNGTGYLWDRGRNPSVPFNQTSQYWYPDGNMPPYNASASCVYYDSTAPDDNTWKLDNCYSAHSFICQRHRYDPEYGTGDLGENLLAPGKWYVDVQTSLNYFTTSCFVQARVQSGIQLFSGFTTSLVSDEPGLDPVQDSPNNMVISYVHTTDLLRTPILLQASLYDAYNATFYTAARYQFRVDCSYPWVSQTFTCPDDSTMNEMAIMHYGEDDSGYAFQRVTFAHCSKEVLTCGNGGIRSNGSCICDEYWQGKYCTIPICVNNGTLDANKQYCKCPTGFSGANCQFDQCLKRTPYQFTTSQKTLAIIIEATKNNKNNLDQLSQNLSAMIANATAQKPDWFGNYILVAFNSFQVTTAIYSLPSVAAVQQAIKALNSAGVNDDGNCVSNIFAAIDKVLMQSDRITFPDSQILLFTASTAGDYMNRGDTVAHFGATEAQLTWVYDTNSKCGQAPDDASAAHLIRLSYATDGNTLYVNSALLSSFFGTYLASRFYVATLSNPTYKTNLQCSADAWYIQVESSMSSVYITTTNFVGSITAVKDSQGILIETEQIFADGLTKFVKFTPSVPGVYTINLSSPGLCLASIYSNSGTKVYQYFAHTTAADPTGSHIDGTQKTPNAGQSTIATFHTPNRGSEILKYVEIVDLVTNQDILSSPLYLRESCSFEYYSDPFVCQSDLIAVIVYGQDRTYAQFKRQLVGFCINGTLPTNPPVTIAPPVTVVSTAAPKTPVSTAAPITVASTTAPKPPASTAAPITVASTTVPKPPASTAAPITVVSTAAPKTPVSTAAPITVVSTAAPTSPASTAAPITSKASPTVTLPPMTTTTADPFEALQVDTVFLLDVSSSVQPYAQDIITFVNTLMHPFSVGLDHARVGIIPVAGNTTNYLFTSIVGLNGILSSNMLNTYLNQAYSGFNDYGDTGQYLMSALSISISSDYRTVDNGFRPKISNHALIYVTTTTDFSDNPSTANILSKNLYGMVTVGYGPGIKDMGALQKLAGGNGCAFYAPDRTTLLSKLVPLIQELVLTSANNGGVYCGN